jgi:hypothetical protein
MYQSTLPLRLINSRLRMHHLALSLSLYHTVCQCPFSLHAVCWCSGMQLLASPSWFFPWWGGHSGPHRQKTLFTAQYYLGVLEWRKGSGHAPHIKNEMLPVPVSM